MLTIFSHDPIDGRSTPLVEPEECASYGLETLATGVDTRRAQVLAPPGKPLPAPIAATAAPIRKNGRHPNQGGVHEFQVKWARLGLDAVIVSMLRRYGRAWTKMRNELREHHGLHEKVSVAALRNHANRLGAPPKERKRRHHCSMCGALKAGHVCVVASKPALY
jgi:hypothetical protein